LRLTLTLPVNSNDSFALLPQLASWAEDRRARGGAPLTLRLAHSDDLRDERATADRNRWPILAHTDPSIVFANLRRTLDWLLTPERLAGLRLVVASDRAADHAHAWRLARSRGVMRRVDHEVRWGVATGLGEVMKRVVGGIRLRVPVVGARGEARSADYLTRRVRQLSEPEHEVQDDAMIPSLEVPPMGARRVTDADPCSPEGSHWFDTVAELAHQPLPRAPVDAVAADVSPHLARAAEAGASWGERRGST